MLNKLSPIERCDCDCDVIHNDIVNQVKDKMPQEETLYDLAELFKVLFYSLDDDHVKLIFDHGLIHINEKFN